MGRFPISIEKIKVVRTNHFSFKSGESKEEVKYLVKIEEKGREWLKTFICGREELIKFKDEIDNLIVFSTTSEVLRISEEKANIVDEHYKSDPLCKICNFKLSHNCDTCLFILQSPLERKLYLELLKSHIFFQTQYGINWNGRNIPIEGKTFGDKQNNFKEVLTIVDFFIDKNKSKLCVYTDGHTYHERTEDQAQRDRNIDRKLQELGYKVLRYTGKDVNENLDRIINDIKKWIN
jgi:hypothetical protein